MNQTKKSLDQKLLITSGVVAALVVATINLEATPVWPGMVSYAAFITLFLASANWERLGWSARTARISLLSMLLISVIELTLHPDTATLILAVVLMASVPYHFSPRRSWQLLLLANAAYLAVLEISLSGQQYIVAWASLTALQAFAITSSLSRCREKEQQELLARQNNELIAARAVLAQQSQAEERLRIAGDLHDSVGHQLTALRLQLEALAHVAPPEMQPSVQSCQELSAALLEDIRAVVRRMSGEECADLPGAIAALAQMTPGVAIRIEGELPSVSAELGRQLVFCLQEAINNAVRHGGADLISLRCEDGALRVLDNGSGMPANNVKAGFGLNNIRKRLSHFGGSASLRNAEAKGGCELLLHFNTDNKTASPGAGEADNGNSATAVKPA
ncbi:MAG: histidine kinase [Halieaceae bacterium]|jgi:signal transduction histidine kinase|nr:histidine kinase [Halieaceae bacterium]